MGVTNTTTALNVSDHELADPSGNNVTFAQTLTEEADEWPS